ncbi:glycine betaine ABC transporter substrate-binding protein [Virgibacillus necropolis]|uniref:glycine betaine ABC transporter substrate-binding protein n=1 Tax=Virgibacillus necropolis TaxID=163877 RepID=UPI00385177A3
MNFKNSKLLILGIILVMLLTACGGGNSNNNENSESSSGNKSSKEKTIDMAQINWAENIAATNMWKVILENRGYDVKFHSLNMGVIMKALEKNDGKELDVTLEVWLPVQDKQYYEKYKDDVFFAETTWYDKAKVGLVVPSYMKKVDSITDLKKYREKFEGKINGFESGAGTMLVTEDMIKEYGLNYELVPSSTPAMLGALKEAIDNKEPIVVPLWKPHRAFANMDLKFLKDPKKTYGEVEKIHFAAREGFNKEFPEVAKWMKNWQMDDQSIGTLMSYVNKAEEPIEGARKWVKENQDLINKWVGSKKESDSSK